MASRSNVICWMYCVWLLCTCCYPNWGFSVLIPQLYGKRQGTTRKDEARSALSKLVNLLLLCMLRSLYFEYWLWVNMCCTADTGCQHSSHNIIRQLRLASLGWRQKSGQCAKWFARRSVCFWSQSGGGVLFCLRSRCSHVTELGGP
jgi:hypothetical protein